MKCPFCGEIEDKVVDSRLTKDEEVIRRRRECLACSRRFTTYERIEEIMYLVVKKDDRREPFDRQKLLTGMLKACQKRPVKLPQLEEIVQEVEALLHERTDKEIPAHVIGEHVIRRLQELDKVAFVRFASVYRDFKDINQFMEELKHILETK